MIVTIAWFLLGNPFGIDNAYIALVMPLVVMGASSLLTRIQGGTSDLKRELP